MKISEKSLENLINLRDRTAEERSEIARKGGLAAQAANRRRKTLKEELSVLLADPELQKQLCEALIGKALTGSASAFATIRDTLGEKPTSTVGVYPATMVTAEDLDRLSADEQAVLSQLMLGGLLDEKENMIESEVQFHAALSVDAKEKLLKNLLEG